MASKTRNRFDLIRFLDQLDCEIPVLEGQKIIAVSDNLSTRGTQEVTDWLANIHAGVSSSPQPTPGG